MDFSRLPDLPKGWSWTAVGHLTDRITKGASPKWQGFSYASEGIKFVRSQNVGWGKLDLSHIAFLPAPFNQKQKRSVLRAGDVLLNIVGASIGRAAIATREVAGGNVNQAVAVVRPSDDALRSHYLMLYFVSPTGQERIHSEKVDVARANVSLTDISNLPLPLAHVLEQERIVDEIERHFSVADAIEQSTEQTLKQAERLRQSILKRAFEGKLIPQDPTDEPAEKLLERIKAQKAKLEAEQKVQRKRKRKSTKKRKKAT